MNDSKSGARLGRAGLVCAMLLVASLTGCGGGGSSSTPPPTGNNPPAPPAPPPPPPATVTLNFKGQVTDEPIANAVVTATVAGQEFQTTADADGNYTLPIEIPEDEAASAFVTLYARGVGDQSFVEFTSIVGSFASLVTAAGDDDTLTADENFATQITNVTTAAAVLMQQANGGNPITSDATLAALVSQVNAQDVLDLATAIKLSVDKPDEYPLPDGATSILELASDAETRQAFVNTVYLADPNAFSAMQTELAADPRLAQDIDEAALIERGAITTAMLSTDAGFTFNYGGRIQHFDFEADHSGWLISEFNNVAMTWEIDGKQLKITFDEPIVSSGFEFEDCFNGDTVHQVEAVYTTEGATVTFLSPTQVTLTITNEVTFPGCPDRQPFTLTNTSARTILSMDMLQPVTELELAGTAQTLYVWNEATQTVVADIADIGDGTGTTRLTNQSFTWSIVEGKLISVDFENGAHAEYADLRQVDDVLSDIYWEVRTPNDGPVFAGAGASVHAEPQGSMEVSADTVVGRFYQFGVGDETMPDPRLKGFRLRFDADFTGSEEYDYIAGPDQAVVTITSKEDPINAFRWSIEDDSVVVRRTWDVVEEVDGCLHTDANCELWDERTIMPLAMEGNRLYVMEVRRVDFDQGISESTPATQLVRFYDYEAATEGAEKLRPTKVSGFKSRELMKGKSHR